MSMMPSPILEQRQPTGSGPLFSFVMAFNSCTSLSRRAGITIDFLLQRYCVSFMSSPSYILNFRVRFGELSCFRNCFSWAPGLDLIFLDCFFRVVLDHDARPAKPQVCTFLHESKDSLYHFSFFSLCTALLQQQG
jgi:hypothetical protein